MVPVLRPVWFRGSAVSQCVVGCCVVVFRASGRFFFLFRARHGLIGLGRRLAFLALLRCGALCCAALCCAVLCRAMLRCVVLCCAVVWCAVLCPALPCRSMPYRAVLCLAVPCCAVLCCGVPRCAVPCRAMPCCAVLCYAVPCCAVLRCSVPHCAVGCCVVLCCAVPCCAVLWCAVLCCWLAVPPGPAWGGGGKGQTGDFAVWISGALRRSGFSVSWWLVGVVWSGVARWVGVVGGLGVPSGLGLREGVRGVFSPWGLCLGLVASSVLWGVPFPRGARPPQLGLFPSGGSSPVPLYPCGPPSLVLWLLPLSSPGVSAHVSVRLPLQCRVAGVVAWLSGFVAGLSGGGVLSVSPFLGVHPHPVWRPVVSGRDQVRLVCCRFSAAAARLGGRAPLEWSASGAYALVW